jgi:hypothetical protein
MKRIPEFIRAVHPYVNFVMDVSSILPAGIFNSFQSYPLPTSLVGRRQGIEYPSSNAVFKRVFVVKSKMVR